MASLRKGPPSIKRNRSYDVPELASACGVHKNTVRAWQRAGLKPLDGRRPTLFHGEAVLAFLANRKQARKAPCPPGTLYCFRCRAPRQPALGMVDFQPVNATSGNIKALCEACGTVMHRRAPRTLLAAIMPGHDVQISEAPTRLSECMPPSLNCHLGRDQPDAGQTGGRSKTLAHQIGETKPDPKRDR